eukprot:CAMPEP_0198145686 /NCGR_PEP_ID=MMETSP1443-20131203/24844_1 /TAXON_ID=186043 /ORGANISM="Entomoneis sp., Strain CCMP2396" /LENGTH=76 /DNA_ID=CAMNT_0043809387 /DNA_START=94 /DNA_END=324 /DNA_ORIENTATION=-
MHGSLGLVRDRREMQRRLQFQRSPDSQIPKNGDSPKATTTPAMPWSFPFGSKETKKSSSVGSSSSFVGGPPKPALE